MLFQDHTRNLAVLERILREKEESQARVVDLEAVLQSVAPAAPEPVGESKASDAVVEEGKAPTTSVTGDDYEWLARIRSAYLAVDGSTAAATTTSTSDQQPQEVAGGEPCPPPQLLLPELCVCACDVPRGYC